MFKVIKKRKKKSKFNFDTIVLKPKFMNEMQQTKLRINTIETL